MSERPQLAEFGGESLLEAFRQAAQNAHVGVAVTLTDDDPPRNVYVNKHLEELLGRTSEEIDAISVWGCLAPEEQTKLQDLQQRRRRGELLPTTYETVVIRPDGERVPIEVSHARTEIDGRGAVVSFLLDLRDRHRAEQALNESEQRFRHLVENAPDGVAILRGPRITFLNPRAAVLLGLGR
ncbi:MAG TPA: PAS domain S-box protein, partial [Polyangiaceae bacterium]|nr:PAS domain S-box protein [Polyangiaceae bacterium]